MKTRFFAVTAALLLMLQSGFSEETNNVSVELKSLIANIQSKLNQGKRAETDFTADIKNFDELYARQNGEKSDAVADILIWKAMLYLQVLKDPEKALAVFRQIKRDQPSAQEMADAHISLLESIIRSRKMKEKFPTGVQFPDFEQSDVEGKNLSTANYRGKVVLIDFWATWCAPCLGELPNLLNTYQKYHDKGFEIIGVSLDDDQQRLETFVKRNKMAWPQLFDGKGWEGLLVQKYGIISIPATFLIDQDGKIIATDLRGPELEEAVSKALAKK